MMLRWYDLQLAALVLVVAGAAAAARRALVVCNPQAKAHTASMADCRGSDSLPFPNT